MPRKRKRQLAGLSNYGRRFVINRIVDGNDEESGKEDEDVDNGMDDEDDAVLVSDDDNGNDSSDDTEFITFKDADVHCVEAEIKAERMHLS